MNLRKMFRPFKRRLLCEGIIKSLVIALMLGASAVFLVSLICHLLIREVPAQILAIIFAVTAFSGFFVLFTVRFYPTKKKIAARIDELGLKERVSTMLEYSKDDSIIAGLQRADAMECLNKASAKQIKFSLSKKQLITCLTCICLAVIMVLLPYDAFALSSPEDVVVDDSAETIRELISGLRDEVRESALSKELKEELNGVIDNLEKELENSGSDLERAAKIEKARQEMAHAVDRAITKDEIGEALQKYELTRTLGEAISKGSTEKVTSALENLEESLADNPELAAELAESILSALEDSGVEADDGLYSALDDFSEELTEMTEPDEMTEAFEKAEKEINSALENQAEIEAEAEEMDRSLSDAEDEVLGNEKSEAEEEEEEEKSDESGQSEGERSGEKTDGEQSGERSDRENPGGEMSGQNGGIGSGEGEYSTMTEGIYDPLSGSVTYGEVFAAYYAEYLSALEAGDVPEELQEIIDQYFSSLN